MTRADLYMVKSKGPDLQPKRASCCGIAPPSWRPSVCGVDDACCHSVVPEDQLEDRMNNVIGRLKSLGTVETSAGQFRDVGMRLGTFAGTGKRGHHLD